MEFTEKILDKQQNLKSKSKITLDDLGKYSKHFNRVIKSEVQEDETDGEL